MVDLMVDLMALRKAESMAELLVEQTEYSMVDQRDL